MGSEQGGRAAEAKARSLSMSIEALKEQARGHEQREEWTNALQLYLQAISRLGEEDPDMGLYNRTGDLFTRVGNMEGAIEYYEMAVDLYLDAELANNAIAILKKILRNVPDRKEVYLKMGQIRAQQGFLPDARGYFLGYAERNQKTGDLEEAFRALREFCDLAPDDLEIRVSLAGQLQAHDRTEEALSLLTSSYHRFRSTGQQALAAEVEETIAAIDAEFDIPEGPDEDVLGFESTSLSPEPQSTASEGGIELASDFGDIKYEGADESAAEGLALEHTSLAPSVPAEEPDSGALTAADFGEADDGGRGLKDYVDPEAGEEMEIEVALPEIELGDDEAEVEVWGAATSWSDEDEDEDEVTELPLMDFSDSGEATEDGGRWAEGADTYGDDPEMIGVPGVDAAPIKAPTGAVGGLDLDQETVTANDDLTYRSDLEDAPETDLGVTDDALGMADDGFGDVVPPTAGEDGGMEHMFNVDELNTEAYPPLSADSADVVASFDDAAFEPAHDDLWKQQDDDVVLNDVPAWSPENALEESMDAVSDWSDAFGDETEDPSDAFAAETQDLVDDLVGEAQDLSDAADEDSPIVSAGAAQSPTEPEFGNRDDAKGFGGSTAEAVETAEPEVSSDYVDLNTMVFGAPKERTTRWNVESEEPQKESDFDFQQMLAQFKEKVAENVEVGDVKAHYDLGTAFKEMGLLDEAITEFQQALRADGKNLATYEVLGQCFMDKGQPEVAVRSLTMATQMPFEVEDELLGIYYYLGRAHETLGNSGDAVEFYEKVFALDINFQDVTERLRELR